MLISVPARTLARPPRALGNAVMSGPAMALNPSSNSAIPMPNSALLANPVLTEDTARQNKLLAAMRVVDWRRIAPRLERVLLPLAEALYESGVPSSQVYFLTTATTSLL